jgi:hypothetical protein
MISAHAPGNYTKEDIKASSLEKASEYCKQMGKNMMFKSSDDSRWGGFGSGVSVAVYFVCVNEKDYKPSYPTQAPNTTIENNIHIENSK